MIYSTTQMFILGSAVVCLNGVKVKANVLS